MLRALASGLVFVLVIAVAGPPGPLGLLAQEAPPEKGAARKESRSRRNAEKAAARAEAEKKSAASRQPASKPEAAKKADEKPKPAATAAEKGDPIDRIKEEGLKRSQVMATLSYLTDVIGPRLTGSPNLKRANEWTRDTLTKWGLSNAHLEPWGPFGRGWSLKRFQMQVIEPQCIPLIAFPKAWSPGTDGVLAAPVVYLEAKTEAEMNKFKGKLKGAIVLLNDPAEVAAHFEPLARRQSEKDLLNLADASEPTPFRMGQSPLQDRPAANRQARGPNAAEPASRVNAAGTPPAATPNAENASPRRRAMFSPEMRAQMELARKKSKFATDEGAAMLVDVSRQGDGGTLFVAQAGIPGVSPFPVPGQPQPAKRVSSWDKDAPKFPPQVTMSKEHYNRLVRMIKQGETLKIAAELSVQFHDGDLMAYNTIAEIPGTDLKDEVVMVGGHMDSWHSGTGATDNAAGVSCAMEAVRILKALDLKPRRTIRIGLWSGEEQGLYGSRAYVAEHFGKSSDPMAAMFGTPETSAGREGSQARQAPKPEFAKFSGYFNLDNGTGKIRGVYMQGNEAVRPIFRKWLEPFREMGASTLTIANTGGTDHQAFDGIGLPGFQFIQDPIHYDTRTHHSNMDVYDSIQAEDMKQASVILASFVYNAAILDQKLPRKPDPRPASDRSNRTANR